MNKLFRNTVIICLLGGCLGLHRFYVGKITTGALMLLTVGGLGIWTLIDLVSIVRGQFEDADGNVIQKHNITNHSNPDSHS